MICPSSLFFFLSLGGILFYFIHFVAIYVTHVITANIYEANAFKQSFTIIFTSRRIQQTLKADIEIH